MASSSPFDFIDRKQEVALFKQMLAGETRARILSLLIEAGKGKSYLMSHLKGHCQENTISVAAVDFDTRHRGSISFWKFACHICSQWGWEHFPTVQPYEKQHGSVLPLVQIETGSGSTKVDFGEGNEFTNAQIAGVAGRDQINVENVSYRPSKDQTAAQQERLMLEMGQALQTDLKTFCRKNQSVLLLDTFEHAARETRNWIDEWLFSHLPDCYPNLFVAMASRPEPDLQDYLQTSRPWHPLMYVCKEFGPPEEKDVRKYVELWGLEVEEELKVFIKAAHQEMALLAKLRDLYRIAP